MAKNKKAIKGGKSSKASRPAKKQSGKGAKKLAATKIKKTTAKTTGKVIKGNKAKASKKDAKAKETAIKKVVKSAKKPVKVSKKPVNVKANKKANQKIANANQLVTKKVTSANAKAIKPLKKELTQSKAKEKVVLKSETKIVNKPVKELLPKPEKTLLVSPPKAGKSRGRKKKKKGDDEDEFDGSDPIDPALLEILSATESAAKKKKGPKIIKTFVNPINALPSEFDTDTQSGKNKKEPKGKFELEYVVRTSAGILYECLSTPSGLSEWFADDVNIRDGIFTFFWDGSEQKAKLLGYKDEKFIRFRWLDKPEGTYFEFKIEKDELTGDISLIITDFAEEATDKTTSQLLWDSQVNKLLHVLGAV